MNFKQFLELLPDGMADEWQALPDEVKAGCVANAIEQLGTTMLLDFGISPDYVMQVIIGRKQ